MSENNNRAVFGDLTALYSARREFKLKIDYAHLDRSLKAAMGVESLDSNMWFTLFAENNEGQTSFIQTLKDLDWDVNTVALRDIRRHTRHTDYRFDAEISYQLGLAVGDHSEIVVVSDSFELARSLQTMKEEEGDDIKLSLAFYSEALDSRWWKLLNDKGSGINFIDLDALMK